MCFHWLTIQLLLYWQTSAWHLKFIIKSLFIILAPSGPLDKLPNILFNTLSNLNYSLAEYFIVYSEIAFIFPVYAQLITILNPVRYLIKSQCQATTFHLARGDFLMSTVRQHVTTQSFDSHAFCSLVFGKLDSKLYAVWQAHKTHRQRFTACYLTVLLFSEITLRKERKR